MAATLPAARVPARWTTRSASCCCRGRLERFILRDQAEDLLRAERRRRRRARARALRGARAAARAAARRRSPPRQARRVAAVRRGDAARGRHLPPAPVPARARAAGRASPGCELWYGRWDRYERALDAGRAMRARLDELHEQAAARSALTFVASEELAAPGARGRPRGDARAARRRLLPGARRPRAARRRRVARPPRAGVRTGRCCARSPSAWATGSSCCWSAPGTRTRCAATPTPPPAARTRPRVAGHAQRRGGRAPHPLRRRRDRALQRRPVQRRRRCPTGSSSTPGSAAARSPAAGRRAHLGARGDGRAGRRGLRRRARAHAGARARPDPELRAWALEQTARRQNAPLWERLRELGVDTRVEAAALAAAARAPRR